MKDMLIDATDKSFDKIFANTQRREGSTGKVNTEEIKEIIKEKGKVSAMLHITKTTDISVSGAKQLVNKIASLV